MNRIITLLLSLSILAACNEKDRNKPEQQDPCSGIIMIKKAKVEHDIGWMRTNTPLFAPVQPQRQGKCGDYMFAINAGLVSDLAAWLKDNRENICIPETYDYIECSHYITDPDEQRAIGRTLPHSIYKLSTLKKKIALAKGDYENDTYNRYMNLSFTAFWGLDIKMTDFDPKGNCYSLPLLRSIVSKYKLTDDALFVFKRVSAAGEKDRIIFTVKTPAGDRAYYNFSHIPPFLGEDEAVPEPL